MNTQRHITFVVAVKSRGEMLENNFLASSCLSKPHPHEILVQENYPSASKAYNDAIDKSSNDLIVFLHQDMILPESWLSDLERALAFLEADDPQWGVIGCYGETRDDYGRGYVYSSGLGILGKPFERPAQIQTLDEIVLILRKSSGLRFDETLPHFHMYGTDICMRAEEMGRKNYAISAFCVHNTQPGLILADEFYECYWHVKKVWKHRLPIQTTCIRVTRFDTVMYKKRLGEMYLRYIRWKEFGGSRATDVQKLLKEVDILLQQESAAGGVQ
jgi:hypothetical protein